MSSVNSAISIWKEKLLDISLKNKLLNFKESSKGCLEILAPGIENIYGQIIENKSLDILDYQNKNEGETKYLSENEILKLFEKKITNNTIILYKKDFLISNVIKDINKAAKLVLEEKGINTLFLALGFIHWNEEIEPNTEFMAPILLIPIRLSFTSIIEPTRIQLYENEVIVNPAFKYKLASEYNINLPELQEDESIISYLSKVESIAEKLKWRISHKSIISTFSFMKMHMYEDLSRNSEKISKNANIVSLLRGKKGAKDIKKPDITNKVDQNILLNNVIDADSSQVEAVKLAKSGISFVLQGPPGTGKSQTITNIIAELLHDKKKVLFVSEKVAALNVVFNNLKKVSLEEFCLELHSDKSNKKNIIDELNTTLRKKEFSLSNKFDKELKLLEDSQFKLDQYVNELHKFIPLIDRSLYELYGEVGKLHNTLDIKFPISITKKGDVHLQRILEILEEYKEYEGTIGYNYKDNEWYGYNNLNSSANHRENVKDAMANLINIIEEFIIFKRQINKDYGINIGNYKDLQALNKLISILPNMDFYHKDIFNISSLSEIIEDFLLLEKKYIEINKIKEQVSKVYNDNIYGIDIKSMLHKYQNLSKESSKQVSKQYRKDRKVLRTSEINSQEVEYETALLLFKQLVALKEIEESIVPYVAKAKDILGDSYLGDLTNWSNINTYLKKLREVAGIFDVSSLGKFDIDSFEVLKNDSKQLKKQITTLIKRLSNELSILENSFDQEIYDLYSVNLSTMESKFQKCLESIEKLENWNRFIKLLNKMNKSDLIPFVDYCISKKLQINDFSNIYKKLFYNNWIENIWAKNTVFSSFNRITHDKFLNQFIEKDKNTFKISQAKIKSMLSKNYSSLDFIDPNSEAAQIMREGAKKRNQMSIYDILNTYNNLILKIKPCFLMSPLSVSAFLGPDIKFDVVIFDEASQIFPQDAIGSIYRANQVIVVGDTKQMPPSDFFNNDFIEENKKEEQEEDINDFESLLDICSVSYYQTTLRWHYRSKMEELITFSNKHFYKNNLVSFPAAEIKRPNLGVDFHYVKDGIFNRKNKTNTKEAELVADLVFEHFKNNPNRSLGVVAFNQSQQSAIESAIDKKRRLDNSIDAFFNDSLDEYFFVKNLETVQGYERDTIIFSVGYAKDEEGKFILNFGPLNRQGGERRLNVAVTRAKYNFQVVSSIKSFDIDASRTESIGVMLLKDYLDFAENVSSDKLKSSDHYNLNFGSDFEIEIYDFLRDNGYIVETQLGNSEYKIGLAIRNPNGDKFILAIECDGPTYRLGASVRDRDRLRKEVLENFGWNYYRIWSTDWFKNKKIEKERLLDYIKTIVKGPSLNKKQVNKQEATSNNSIIDLFDIEDIKKEEIHKKAESKLKTISKKEVVAEVKSNISNKKEVTTQSLNINADSRYSGKYEIFPEVDHYRYRLKASNGEILCVSERYKSIEGTKKAIETVIRNVNHGIFSTFDDKNKMYKFKLTSKNSRTLIVSANYATAASAEKAVESFKRFAATAKIIVLEEGILDDSATGLEPIIMKEVSLEVDGKYEIFKEKSGEFSWMLKANNGQILAQGDKYGSINGCLRAINSFKNAVEEGKFYSSKDKKGLFRYSLYSKSGRLILTGESYSTKSSAKSAANSVRAFYKEASIIEMPIE